MQVEAVKTKLSCKAPPRTNGDWMFYSTLLYPTFLFSALPKATQFFSIALYSSLLSSLLCSTFALRKPQQHGLFFSKHLWIMWYSRFENPNLSWNHGPAKELGILKAPVFPSAWLGALDGHRPETFTVDANWSDLARKSGRLGSACPMDIWRQAALTSLHLLCTLSLDREKTWMETAMVSNRN